MKTVFVSYSRDDMDFAKKLAGDLETAGYDAWWDMTDLQGGDDWVRKLEDAIAASDYFVVVLTPNSIKKDWVKKEYTQALALHKKIIPIMLIQCEVPFALNIINYVDFTKGEYADNFKKLLAPLAYTGEPIVVAPYKKTTHPPALLKYGIPALIGFVILLAIILSLRMNQPETPTVTSTPSLAITTTVTSMPEPSTTTSSPTVTTTSTQTLTLTPTATGTVSPTAELHGVNLEICINTEVSSIYVRSGPGQTYAATNLYLPTPLPAPSTQTPVCPWFSARIQDTSDARDANGDKFYWLLVAQNQPDIMQLYKGKWIRNDLLAKYPPITLLPVVTLTATPTPSNTPTITPSFTPTLTPTASDTPLPTPTNTAISTDTPTETATP